MKFLMIFFIVACAPFCSMASSSSLIQLRDWKDSQFNQCLLSKVQKHFSKLGKEVLFLNQYSTHNQPQPYQTVDAEFLVKASATNSYQVYVVKLISQAESWQPLVEYPYLGYQTESIVEDAPIFEYASSILLGLLNLQDCTVAFHRAL